MFCSCSVNFFQVYINDLESSTSIYDFVMYADDATLFYIIESILEANRHIVLNSELDNTRCWLASNKISLNVDKTRYVIFHTNHKQVVYTDLKINNIIIERVVNFDFLRLLLVSMLNRHVILTTSLERRPEQSVQ